MFICVGSSKILYRFGVPTLLMFILLGMVFGSDGLVGIPFDNFEVAKQVSSVALVFIMFYGGFGTNWKMARPVALPSILMSTLGTVVTALLTGVFCHFVLRMEWLEGLLVGSVIGSTDAASVFSILRSKKLNLKGGLASLLEIESGSNDPISYMMTVIVLALMSTGADISVLGQLFAQIAFGLGGGFLLAYLAVRLLRHASFEISGLHTILVVAVALAAYALPELIGGNGYLSVYIVGIVLGNSKILHKRTLVNFFDGITWLMQIVLFFMLGLLSFPSQMPAIILPALAIALFMTFVARPVATFGILSWFKMSFKQKILVSWAGLRGAASIVFAIFAMTSGVYPHNDVFHIVFFVALLSVTVQGTLLPPLAKKLGLVEATGDSVLRTFNDYQDESGTKLVEFTVRASDSCVNKSIMDADLPEEVLVVMIKRGKEFIVPKGATVIREGDILVLNGMDTSKFLA